MSRWSKEEEKVLVNNWEDMSLDKLTELKKLNGRTRGAIRKKANRLGLPKKESVPTGESNWTKEEEETLKENYALSTREKLEGLLEDRTWGAIRKKAKRMGLDRINSEEAENSSYEFSVVHHNIDISDDKLTLIPLGDIHYGHPACRLDMVEDLLQFLEEEYERPYRIVLMGDLWEGATTRSPNSLFEVEVSPQEQYETMLSLLSPYKDKILGAIVGNHEQFATRITGLQKMRDFCREMGIPFLKYKGIVDLYLNGISYRIFFQHGSTSSRTPGGKMNALYRMNEVVPDADIYLHAHTHTRTVGSDSLYSSLGENVKRKTRLYGLTGSFLDYPGTYADRKNYSPSSLGVIKCDLYTNKKEVRMTI